MTGAARATDAGGPGLRSLPLASPSRWLVLALLVLGYALYNLDKSIIAIMIEPLKAEFGLGDRQISLLSAGMTLPIAIFCIPMGRMIDRVNRKIMVALLVIG